jgi:hypothetical protein
VRLPFQKQKFSRDSIWFQAIIPGGSVALCAVVAFIFWLQPDCCAAMLVLPRWMWIVPGLLLALPGWTRKRKRMVGIAATLWFSYAVFFTQEFRSLVRFGNRSISQNSDPIALRVISLNCNGGDEGAAAEVGAFHPDLALFEESPLRPVLRGMAVKILGPDAESFCGSDVSIVARGKITPIAVENVESAPFAHARIQFASGVAAEIFVVRMQPYNIRADLWSLDCWRKQYQIRQRQRSQFEWLEREIKKVPAEVPVIIGGDFNLPAGDRLFDGLRFRLQDSFRRSGHGWGDTLDNDLPVLRIDQIWYDNHFRSISVEAHRTQNSDHRMVICDLLYSAAK